MIVVLIINASLYCPAEPRTPVDPCDRVKFILEGEEREGETGEGRKESHTMFTELEELRCHHNKWGRGKEEEQKGGRREGEIREGRGKRGRGKGERHGEQHGEGGMREREEEREGEGEREKRGRWKGSRGDKREREAGKWAEGKKGGVRDDGSRNSRGSDWRKDRKEERGK